jgi:hypothetical protein
MFNVAAENSGKRAAQQLKILKNDWIPSQRFQKMNVSAVEDFLK